MVSCLASLLLACGGENPAPTNTRVAMQANESAVVGAWATAPYGPYPLGPLTRGGTPTPGAPEVALFPGNQANNQSFRMIIHPTIGGRAVRVRLSNLVGDRPIRFENISIAKGNPLTPNIDASTQTLLTVRGQVFGVVQAGEELITDLIPFEFEASEDLAVSFHVAGESGPMTWHAVSFAPQFIARPNSGDQTQDATGTAFQQVSVGWFFISGLDVLNPQAKGSVVTIGDSITDGAYQALNQRWPDFWLKGCRLLAKPLAC
ncbi:MAG TPA: hypothetical protein VFV43_01480 [Limnobacter sp.]|nr:hypothetical protein [Limnobacter sp.]